MRILIDVLHPAHVHFFREFRREMLESGHDVRVTARSKDVTTALLDTYRIPHDVLSEQRTGRAGLVIELLARSRRLASVVREYRPDVMTGIMGPSIALVGKLLRIPTVVFYDTELATTTNRFVYPLATAVCTPDSYLGSVKGNHITYAGYHELAYLHPSRFVPDEERLAAFGLSIPYSVVRFTSWQASHDLGESGLSLEAKLDLVRTLREAGDVVVSSEGTLPEDLERYRLEGPVADIHHVLAFADLVIGESATMISEAAVLGVPGIFIYRRPLGYLQDLEQRYGLVHRILPDDLGRVMVVAKRVLDDGAPSLSLEHLLKEKIDVTAWMSDFFERRAWES